MQWSLVTEKLGATGAVIAAMSCASCFPALGALGSALGIGFLAQFEGLFINTLLPLFAAVALLAALLSWWSHRKHLRGLLAAAGPAMVLATLYLFWFDAWSTYMFYIAIGMMAVVGLWDLISPPNRACNIQTPKQEGA